MPAAMVAMAFVLGTAFGDYRRHHNLRRALLRAGFGLGSMLCGDVARSTSYTAGVGMVMLSPRAKGLELRWVLTWSANWYDCLSMICAQPVGDLTHLGNPYLNMVASRLSRLPYLYSTYLGPMVFTFAIWSLFDRRWKWCWTIVSARIWQHW